MYGVKGAGLLPLSATGSGRAARRPGQVWDQLSLASSALLGLSGLGVLLISLLQLSGPTALQGQLLGAVTVALALLALAVGAVAPGRLPLRTLLLVGLGFAALSAMELMESMGEFSFLN